MEFLRVLFLSILCHMPLSSTGTFHYWTYGKSLYKIILVISTSVFPNFTLYLPSRCPPEFVFLYREFGGDLSLRDDQGRLATDIAENAPSLKTLRTLQGKVETLSWIHFYSIIFIFNNDVLQSFAIILQNLFRSPFVVTKHLPSSHS